MKHRNRLIAAVVALAALIPLPATAQSQPGWCNRTAVYDASTNGKTVLVTGLAGRSIYVCGYTIVSGGTVNISFVSGTGTTCGTGEAALTPAFQTVAQTVIADTSESPRGIRVAPSIDLCIKTSAGVAVQAILHYSQL